MSPAKLLQRVPDGVGSPPSRLCGPLFPAGLHGRPEGQGPTHWPWGRAPGRVLQGDRGAVEGQEAVPICEDRARSGQVGGGPGLSPGLAPRGHPTWPACWRVWLGAWSPGTHRDCVLVWGPQAGRGARRRPPGTPAFSPLEPASAGRPAPWLLEPRNMSVGSVRSAEQTSEPPPNEQPDRLADAGAGVAPRMPTSPVAACPPWSPKLFSLCVRNRTGSAGTAPAGWHPWPAPRLPLARVSCGPAPAPTRPRPGRRRDAAQLLTYFRRSGRSGGAGLRGAEQPRRVVGARGRVAMPSGRLEERAQLSTDCSTAARRGHAGSRRRE